MAPKISKKHGFVLATAIVFTAIAISVLALMSIPCHNGFSSHLTSNTNPVKPDANLAFDKHIIKSQFHHSWILNNTQQSMTYGLLIYINQSTTELQNITVRYLKDPSENEMIICCKWNDVIHNYNEYGCICDTQQLLINHQSIFDIIIDCYGCSYHLTIYYLSILPLTLSSNYELKFCMGNIYIPRVHYFQMAWKNMNMSAIHQRISEQQNNASNRSSSNVTYYCSVDNSQTTDIGKLVANFHSTCNSSIIQCLWIANQSLFPMNISNIDYSSNAECHFMCNDSTLNENKTNVMFGSQDFIYIAEYQQIRNEISCLEIKEQNINLEVDVYYEITDHLSNQRWVPFVIMCFTISVCILDSCYIFCLSKWCNPLCIRRYIIRKKLSRYQRKYEMKMYKFHCQRNAILFEYLPMLDVVRIVNQYLVELECIPELRDDIVLEMNEVQCATNGNVLDAPLLPHSKDKMMLN